MQVATEIIAPGEKMKLKVSIKLALRYRKVSERRSLTKRMGSELKYEELEHMLNYQHS